MLLTLYIYEVLSMKRYIKSFNYEVDEAGYPTHDGISFVSDSDMLDYIADDGETEVTTVEPNLEPTAEEPTAESVYYVVRKTGGSRYYGEPYDTTGCYVRNGKVRDCYEREADRFTLRDAEIEVARRNQRCRNGNPWIYEKAE